VWGGGCGGLDGWEVRVLGQGTQGLRTRGTSFQKEVTQYTVIIE
jgi:hypothetical protein